jgi:hypothetical protein
MEQAIQMALIRAVIARSPRIETQSMSGDDITIR